MTSLVKVVRTSEIDVNPGTLHQLIVFRNSDGEIRMIAVSDKIIPRGTTKLTYDVTLDPIEQYKKEPTHGELRIVGKINEVGKIFQFFNPDTRKAFVSSPADFNWPSIVHVHTFGKYILAIDSLYDYGVQPVVCDTTTTGWCNEEEVRKRIMSTIQLGHILIVVVKDSDTITVVDVIEPQYTHVNKIEYKSMPFVQRFSCVKGNDGSMIDWRTYQSKKSHSHFDVPKYTYTPIADASALPRTDMFNRNPLEFFYYTEGDVPHVWSWRELACPNLERRELINSFVFDPSTLRLYFGNKEREYPIPKNGKDTVSWCFMDFNDKSVHIDKDIVELAEGTSSDCVYAFQLAAIAEREIGAMFYH
jgi:hypothetical protein